MSEKISLRFLGITIGFLWFFSSIAIDTAEARRCIRILCHPSMHGRGYYRKGVHKASAFLVRQLKKNNTRALFSGSFTKEFFHPVNIFPLDPVVILNGKKLTPGKDFIMDPSFPTFSLDTTFAKPLHFGDSITHGTLTVWFRKKKKLIWSVATEQSSRAGITILDSFPDSLLYSALVQIKARQVNRFKEKIIGGYHPGKNNDSVIVVCAHYDHLGRMGKSAMFAGANDNASGTSMVLMFSRYYSSKEERITPYRMVYLFFPAEEAGLLGSKYFTENPPFDLMKIKFLINLDLLGTGEEGFMVVNATEHPKEFELLQSLNQQGKHVKDIRARGPAANSDHYWFYKKGVPCFFIYTLGGTSYYHDIYDLPHTLSLHAYEKIFILLTAFIERL